MNNIVSVAAGVFSGALGAMGLGGGGILIIYLTLFSDTDQMQAQGINLIFFICTALVAVFTYSYKKLIMWQTLLPAILTGIPGAIIGFYMSSSINSSVLSKLFAGLLFIIGLTQIFKKSN